MKCLFPALLLLLAAAPARAAPGEPMHFTCADGTHVTLTYLVNPDAPGALPRTARARIGGHTVMLRSLPTASGTRYGNGQYTWVEHQGGFALRRAQQPSREWVCHREV